jgi:hypothetical protein
MFVDRGVQISRIEDNGARVGRSAVPRLNESAAARM